MSSLTDSVMLDNKTLLHWLLEGNLGGYDGLNSGLGLTQ